ncbi:hypothetical protein EYW47_38670 [Paraburkholderia silviterrae]|uniref:Uncharacterized protein n=1 Tax=Paraburkholderia silviterrae TaxID=2528715 RepID=A0A4R5LY28_9BURK|nr:hypothetical protein EYW47_38670 [Paraburkholderia silviterrae]
MAATAQGPAPPGFPAFGTVAVDGSILVVRIYGRCMNSDAFFSFSAIGVHFSQVNPVADHRWNDFRSEQSSDVFTANGNDPGSHALWAYHGHAHLYFCPA